MKPPPPPPLLRSSAASDALERAVLRSDLRPFAPDAHASSIPQMLELGLEGGGRGEEPQSASEREALNRQLWARAFREERLNLEELSPKRLWASYRIVREQLRVRDYQADEHLRGIGSVQGLASPWTDPLPFTRRRAPQGTEDSWEVQEILSATSQGIPLLPPAAPPGSVDARGRPLPAYDPYEDRQLRHYIEAVEATARLLKLHHGTKADPDKGRHGLQGITDAKTTRLSFPSRIKLVEYEESLIEETLDLLISKGVVDTKRELRDRYAFFQRESDFLIGLAKHTARMRLDSDPEEEKAIMVLRLENFIQRAKDQMDLRLEMHALKQLSLVQGFGKLEPEDAFAQFFKAAQISSGTNQTIDVEARPTPRIVKTG